MRKKDSAAGKKKRRLRFKFAIIRSIFVVLAESFSGEMVSVACPSHNLCTVGDYFCTLVTLASILPGVVVLYVFPWLCFLCVCSVWYRYCISIW